MYRYLQGYQSILGIVILLLVFFYAFDNIHYGIDLADEGLYLSSPSQYAAGNVPFRDEIVTPLRMFDLVLYPVFHYFPDISVIQLRTGWLVFQFAASIVLIRLLAKFSPLLIALLACVSTVLFNDNIFTPGYHSMATMGMIVGSSLWLLACLQRNWLILVPLSMASGLMSFLATLCYVPLLPVHIVPLIVLLVFWLFRSTEAFVIIATAIHLLSLIVFIAISVSLVYALNLDEAWRSAYQAIGSTELYKKSLLTLVFEFLFKIRESYVFLVLTPVIFMVLKRLSNAPGRMFYVVAIFLLITFMVFSIYSDPFDQRWILWEGTPFYDIMQIPGMLLMVMVYFWMFKSTVFSLSLNVPAVISMIRHRASESDNWRLVYFSLLSQGLIYACLQGVLSSMPHKASWAIIIFFSIGVVGCYRYLALPDENGLAVRRAKASMSMICIIFMVSSILAKDQFVYGDYTKKSLIAAFSISELDGIYSNPDRVQALEKTVHYVKENSDANDFLLAIHDIPIFYYLTKRKPAIKTVWAPYRTNLDVQENLISDMKANGHVPAICILYKVVELELADDPLTRFVIDNYSLVASYGPFDIYEPIVSSSP